MKKCDKNHNGVSALLLLKNVRMRNESLSQKEHSIRNECFKTCFALFVN